MGLNLFKFFGTLAAIAAAIQAASMAANTAQNIWGEEEEPQRPGGQYRRSQFMPPPSGADDQMARYAPQNRQPRSDSPLMGYLMKFMR